MDLRFEVSGRINRPVEEVFEAVVNPEKLSGYFTTGGAKGRLETGAVVYWDFHDVPGAFPVKIVEVEKTSGSSWNGRETTGVATGPMPTIQGSRCASSPWMMGERWFQLPKKGSEKRPAG